MLFHEELLQKLSEELESQQATLFYVLQAIQESEPHLWSKIIEELDPENPQVANEYLASLIELYRSVGEADASVLTGYDVVHVLLHNALGCNESNLTPYSQLIPCTRGYFKTARNADGYSLVFIDAYCPHPKLKSNA